MSIPSSTYRLQFNPSFGFKSALRIVPYLKELGISDIYASPIFQAKTGSPHGYDVIDPTMMNADLGTQKEFESLIKKVKSADMHWIQDIVPNHMAYDSQNKWLMDVFEKGRYSKYYKYFDIEWRDTYHGLKGKVLAPFLGASFSDCLENKEIQVRFNALGLSIVYYDLRYPLEISSYFDLLYYRLETLQKRIGEDSKDFQSYKALNEVLKVLSSKNSNKKIDRTVKEFKNKLYSLYEKNKVIKNFMNKNIKEFNGTKGNVESFSLLYELLSRQFYRLSFWKFGMEEINYRRFFNINQLISVTVERQNVFQETHRLIFDLIKKKSISGLRIDHIDGLYDPHQYLKQLKNFLNGRYIVVEKILDENEDLHLDWPCEGSTGYDFLNVVNGIFCNKQNEQRMSQVYEKFIRQQMNFDNLVRAKKRLFIGRHMAGDVDNLAHHMKRVSQRIRYGKDITLYGLKRALVEVLVYFPVYRSYVRSEHLEKSDRDVIFKTIDQALKDNPALSIELKFIRHVLLLDFPEFLSEREKKNWVHFVMRFQQFTGPLMAKGFEDTTLYIYNRLLSLNEVGGFPNEFGIPLSRFHVYNKKKQKRWPFSMNATATHDTKRSEDIRARINVLSEIPVLWNKKINQWRKYNLKKKKSVNGHYIPDANDEYFLYQMLVGGFPFKKSEQDQFLKRMKDYLIKAVREAKVHTAWIQPDEQYERAFLQFLERIFQPSSKNLFLQDFYAFQKMVAHFGILNSLSQISIKMTAPGVPDFYQGTELWDLSFVDPDNRRAVDYEKRKKYLKEIQKKSRQNNPLFIKELLKNPNDGRIKMFLIWKILELRNQNSNIFRTGKYSVITVEGTYRDNIVAFCRKDKNKMIVTLAPRFLTKVVRVGHWPIGKVWKDTRISLPENYQWHECVSGRTLSDNKFYIKDIMQSFPVAVLKN